MAERIPLWYCFGNHMHWVDMQWLWGYHVMPGSTQDMIRFCRETGAKGCVNFDGIGYEKMAAEAPEALDALREAVQAGQIEPSGGSYGQPYGLFHGGESNVRQLIYGARTIKRLLGVWPKTFWEEEFYFFPQLPQMLKQCGFEYASLYFQWTWHTPELPVEPHPVIWWEGIDGSRLKTATRNKLNLHQWPEDFAHLLSDLAEKGPAEVMGAESDVEPLILQWLELMPSPDWMCRSELMIPSMKALMEDDRFEVKTATLSGYLSQASDDIPVRQYQMHEVWHGMTMGKNANNHPASSESAERVIREAEAGAAILSLFGRPYAQWDVYPTWELEEAWRYLLMGQHHDNHECEGLCGHVGHAHIEHAFSLAYQVLDRIDADLGRRVQSHRPEGSSGLARSFSPSTEPFCFGYDAASAPHPTSSRSSAKLGSEGKMLLLTSGLGGDAIELKAPVLTTTRNGERVEFQGQGTEIVDFRGLKEMGMQAQLRVKGAEAQLVVLEDEQASQHLEPGYAGALRISLELPFAPDRIIADSPYAVDEVQPGRKGVRKYPEGDWMTSPQWFEEVEGGILAQKFLSIQKADGTGILLSTASPSQWFLNGRLLELIVSSNDPWDEGVDPRPSLKTNTLTISAHGPSTYSDLWLASHTVAGEAEVPAAAQTESALPARFQALRSEIPGAIPTAFYREEEGYSARGLDAYAGEGMGYPFIVRLVEFNGEAAEGILRVAGQVAKAVKANLLGGPLEELKVTLIEDSDDICQLGGKASEIRLKVQPREIVTLYLDIVEGRKQARDLDAKREIWATVHRVEDEKP